MPRYYYAPVETTSAVIIVPIQYGGTNGSTVDSFANTFNVIDTRLLNTEYGVVTLDAAAKIDPIYLPERQIIGEMVEGPVTLFAGQTAHYTITDYDSFTSYIITAAVGSVSRTDAIITYQAPSTPMVAGFTINDRTINLNIVEGSSLSPLINPVTNPVTTIPNLSLDTSAYENGMQSTIAVQWELASDIGFFNILETYQGSSHLSGWTPTYLQPDQTYYVRAKIEGSVTSWSAWSNIITIQYQSDIIKPALIYAGGSGTFFIQNYDPTQTYILTSDTGTVTQSGADIIYTANLTDNPQSFYINNQLVTFAVETSEVAIPTIVTPATDAIISDLTPLITSSNFSYIGTTQTHVKTRWELSKTSTFTTIEQFSENSTNLTSWTPSQLDPDTTYYIRVKYEGSLTGWTAWSPVSPFITQLEVFGPGSIFAQVPTQYTITNYDPSLTYTLSTSNGTVTRSGNTITYTSTLSLSSGGFTINGKSIPITLVAGFVNKPTIMSPASGSNENLITTFYASTFTYTGATQTHTKTRWELSTDSTFTTLDQFYEGTSNLTSWTPTQLDPDKIYYVRVRYYSDLYGASVWSDTSYIRTIIPITGPLSLYTSVEGVYTIGNYLPTITYTLSTTNGTVRQEGHLVYYKSGLSDVNGGFTINGHFHSVALILSYVNAPSITSPTNNATTNLITTLQSNALTTTGVSQTHTASQWELSTTNLFTTLVDQYQGAAHLTSWTPTQLLPDQTYYVRVRYQGNITGWSAWSPAIAFTPQLLISGPSEIYTGTPNQFIITNYDNRVTYTATATNGTVTISGDTITYISDLNINNGGFTINGHTYPVTLVLSYVNTPTVQPLSTNLTAIPTVTSSSFAYTGAVQTQNKVQWQLATSNTFSTIIESYEGTSNYTSWTPTLIQPDQTYYVRVRHSGSISGYSPWSDPISFKVNTVLSGPSTLYTYETKAFTINNYFPSGTYQVTSTLGTTSRTTDVITYIAGNTAGSASITVNNNTVFNMTILNSYVNKPIITNSQVLNVDLNITITSNVFSTIGVSQSHLKTRWELATDSGFTQLVDFYEGPSNLISWSPIQLDPDQTYYVRVRYSGSITGWSFWSDTVIFTTSMDITGATSLYTYASSNYTIGNYDVLTVYTITPILGTVTRSGNTITYQTGAIAGAGGFIINGKSVPVTLLASYVNTPTITSPTNNAINQSVIPTITASAYSFIGSTQTHTQSRWEIATDALFTTVVQSYEGNGYLTSWTPPQLQPDQTYYVRVRYRGSLSGDSNWSPTIQFTTSIAVSGPTSLLANQTGTYTITNYEAGINYTLTALSGTISRSGNTITYVAGNFVGANGFTINGKTIPVTLTAGIVNTPSITSPTNNATGISVLPTLSSNAFSYTGIIQTHTRSRWEIATDAAFTNIVSFYEGTSNLTTWIPDQLTIGTFYARVKYEGSITGWTPWSTTINFSTDITASGPTSLFTYEAGTFTINNYNASIIYTLTSNYGTVTRTGNTITYTAWGTAGIGGFVINGKAISVTLNASSVNTPSITSPTNNATNVSLKPTISTSAFAYTGVAQSHAQSHWQLSTDNTFTTILQELTSATNLTSWSPTQLNPDVVYYVRVRHEGSKSGWSSWSTVSAFTPSITISGPTTVSTSQSATFTITNYDAGIVYTVTSTLGTITQSGNTITYTAGGSAGTGTITINNKEFTFTVTLGYVNTPTITGNTNTSLITTLSSSTFSVTGAAQTQNSVRWEIATDANFMTLAGSYEGTSNYTSWTTPQLSPDVTYYIRVRYSGSLTGWSAWSTTYTYTPTITLSGTLSVIANNSTTFTITNYNASITYTLSATNGSAGRSGSTITFVGGPTAGSATLNINGKIYSITVTAGYVNTPSITSPGNGATGTLLKPTITATSFSVTGVTQTHSSVRWELSTSSSFGTLTDSYEGTSNLTSWTPIQLVPDQTYYVRVRYNGSVTGWSSWSAISSFTPTLNVSGLTSLYTGQSANFTISPYDAALTYTLTAVLGSVSRSGSTITYNAGSTSGSGGFYLNGKLFSVYIYQSTVNTPSITSPSYGSSNISLTPTITSSSFSYSGQAQSQTSVRWEISTSSSFSPLTSSYEGSSNLTSWTPSGLSGGTTYYVRVRHFGNVTGWSSWSGYHYFTTQAQTKWVVSMSISGDDSFYGVAVDISGNIIVVGRYQGSYPYVAKFDSGGNLLWQKYYSGVAQSYFVSVIVDSSSNIYIAGGAVSSTLKDCIVKLDSSGNFQWGLTLKQNGCIEGISFDGPSWNLYVVGHSGNFNMGWIAKISNSGSYTWGRYTSNMSFMGIGSDGSGNCFACSTVKTQSASLNYGYVYRLDSSGGTTWSLKIVHPSSYEVVMQALHLQGYYIYIVGSYYTGSSFVQGFVMKITTDGSVIWQKNVNGVYECLDVWTDDSANLYVVGYDTSNDAFMISLDSNGSLLWKTSLGGSYGEWFYGVSTHVNGIVVAGQQNTTSGGTGDGMLISFPKTAGVTFAYLVGSGLTTLAFKNPSISISAASNTITTGDRPLFTPSFSSMTTLSLTAYTASATRYYSTFM